MQNPDGTQILGANNKPISGLLLKSQVGKAMNVKNVTGTWDQELVKCYYTPNVVEENQISNKIATVAGLDQINKSDYPNQHNQSVTHELRRQHA